MRCGPADLRSLVGLGWVEALVTGDMLACDDKLRSGRSVDYEIPFESMLSTNPWPSTREASTSKRRLRSMIILFVSSALAFRLKQANLASQKLPQTSNREGENKNLANLEEANNSTASRAHLNI